MNANPERMTLPSRRRTKIVATLGPVSRNADTIGKLIAAGVNVFRLNMSHGTHDDHRGAAGAVREISGRLGEPVALLADLCGPKIRVGTFRNGQIDLVPGSTVTITTRPVEGEAGLIPSQYPALAGDVRPGDRLLLDDGLLELRVESIEEGTEIRCLVIQGGVLKDRKGMNLPGVAVSSPALTDKDRADVHLGLELGVDYFALSFVRRPEDVRDLREYLNRQQANTPIIAKIEKPEALDHLDDILHLADGVMVARGDLGVELPPEHVPLVQQDLIVRARRINKPVIVATQMLESMVQHARPTRAEVSDVSTAVLAGADAVMLSSETSVGAFPVRSVEMMDRIARQMEDWLARQEGAAGGVWRVTGKAEPVLSLQTAVARSLAQLSRDLKARAIVVRSRHGDSALAASGSRPAAPIVSMSMDGAVCRQLSLLWGVIPCQVSAEDFSKPQTTAGQLVRSLNLAQPSDIILLLAGFGDEKPTITVLPV